MFFTYIIYSKTANKYYVGASENPAERLKKSIIQKIVVLQIEHQIGK
jgi:predicted GIY-YIG superfamily endonuclease